MSDIKKVVLAYSGGLDTSVILKWLQDTYQCEVVTFTADIGQGEELATVLEHEAEAVGHQARSHAAIVGLDQGNHHPAPVRHRQIGGVPMAGRLARVDGGEDPVG